MSNNAVRQTGMTLIELIVAIVIIAVGLAGVLSVFNVNVRNSADPMVQKQLLAIAEGMMEEVLLLPFSSAATTGTGSGCGQRHLFDDIDDFSGYTNQPVCDYEGNVKLPGYSVSVLVEPSALNIAVPATDARKITVTVTRNASESVSLVGWRSNWAKE